MNVSTLTLIIRLAFAAFTIYALTKKEEEKQFYNDVLDLGFLDKWAEFFKVRNYLPVVSRVVVELIFLVFVLLPAIFGFSIVGLILYGIIVFGIASTKKAKYFSEKEVFNLNIARLGFLALAIFL